MDYNAFQQIHGSSSFSAPTLNDHQAQHYQYQQQQQQRHQSLQHQQLNLQLGQQLSYQQQQQYQSSLHNASGATTIHELSNDTPSLPQHISLPQSTNHGAFAVQPYASWGSGAILNMNTTRRPRPHAINGLPSAQSFGMQAMQTRSDAFSRPQSVDSHSWVQKVASQVEVSTYDSEMTDVSRPVSQIESDNNVIEIRNAGYEKDTSHNTNQPFQHEIESRRPSQVSDSTYATTRLTTPDMTYPSDSDWSSAERPKSLQQTTFSPMDSPSTGSLRPGSRSRASPVPHNQMRASPYTLESNRRLRWSTGMNVPSQTPMRNPYPYNNNRYSSQFGFSPLNPHNGLSSVSNEAGVTTFAAPGQSLAYSQRMSAGGHFMLHPGYPDAPHQLASQSLYPLLPSDRLHAYGGHFADLSDPPDLFASLNEKPSDPPEEDMNPSDPDLVPHEQELRFTGDLYTPRWVRGQGNKREGWCGLCKPGRWLVLKNSAYWYDKSFTHGVCAQTGAAFAAPDATRRVEGNADAWEGLCGQCGEWLSLVSSKKKGPTTWFRHVSKCHVLHKPKDIPKRRRGTIKRPPLPIVGPEEVESLPEQIQDQDTMDAVSSDECCNSHDHEAEHDHNLHLTHQGEHDYETQQHNLPQQLDHHLFNGRFSSTQQIQCILSPPPISPKTMDQKASTQDNDTDADPYTRETTVVPPDCRQEAFPGCSSEPPKDATSVKSEAEESPPNLKSDHETMAVYDLVMENNDSITVSCADSEAPRLAHVDTKPDAFVQTQDLSASAPSPVMTPISTPQLSETSLSTPQMETPSHVANPLVGLGVQGLHIMTGIPENSAHDISFEEISQLEALYGGSANSGTQLSADYSCDNQQSRTDTRDRHDHSYEDLEPNEIPLPLSATENICMSSQFDMSSVYADNQLHDMRSLAAYSDDVLGLHMDMRMLEHSNNHYSGVGESNLLDSYNGMM